MANELKFTGVVGFISTIETGEDKNGKPFAKGYFIVGEPDVRIPNEIKIEWYNRNSAQALQLGDEVEVFYNMKIREYQDKHYQSINLWKLNNLTRPESNQQDDSAPAENKYSQVAKNPTSQSQNAATEEENTGLPF